MDYRIKLRQGSELDYLLQTDGVSDCRQKVVLNESSTLEFLLEVKSKKWRYFTGPGLTAEVNGRVYCTVGDSGVAAQRNKDGLRMPITMKELWYKLGYKYITAYNINPATSSEFDHIDTHMVVLLGNSSSPLYVNGTRRNNPHAVGTAKYMFWALLQDTGWTLDSRYDAFWPDGVFDLETDKKHVLDNILLLQSLYGGMLFWDSKNMRVALVDEKKYQQNDGYEVRYAKNLIGIERNENRDIYTRLYAYGNGNLNLAAVNGGREYIDNTSYTTEVLEGIVTHSDIYTQSSLLTWAKRQSEVYCKPRYTYSIDVLKYREKEHPAYPQPQLGHIARVFDPEIAPNGVKQRILSIDQNVYNEYDCKLAIGDTVNTFEGTLKDIVKAKEKTKDVIANTSQITGNIVRGEIPALTASNTYWTGVTTNLSGGISMVNQKADNIQLQVTDNKGNIGSLTVRATAVETRVTNAEGDIGNLTVRANLITSRVSNVEGRVTTAETRISQTANSVAVVVTENGQVNASAIIQSINGQSTYKVRADRIVFDGYMVAGRSQFETIVASQGVYAGALAAQKQFIIEDGGRFYWGGREVSLRTVGGVSGVLVATQ